MITFFKKLLEKEEIVDIEKISDQASLSVMNSQYDKLLFGLFVGSEKLSEVFFGYFERCVRVEVDQVTVLSSEVEILQQYLELFKLAKSDSIFYKLNIKYETEEAKTGIVWPFVLFPLVQNALYYGYNTMEKYPLKINIKITSSTLKLEVSNRVNHYVENQEVNDIVRLYKARLDTLYQGRYDLIFNSNSNLFKATLFLQLN